MWPDILSPVELWEEKQPKLQFQSTVKQTIVTPTVSVELSGVDVGRKHVKASKKSIFIANFLEELYNSQSLQGVHQNSPDVSSSKTMSLLEQEKTVLLSKIFHQITSLIISNFP